MRNKLPFLIIGIALSVLFWIFSVEILDPLNYGRTGFNDVLFNHNGYGIVAAITLAMGWVGAAAYYYLINSATFDRWWHWLAIMAVTVVLTPLVCYFAINPMFAGEGKDYGPEMVQFGTYNLIVTAVAFVVASFSIKWWSSNCRHSPF